MPQTAHSATEHTLASPEHAIVFADGLVGCQTWKRFFLLVETDDEELPVALLQSLDDPNVSLMVTDPALVEPSYAPEISRQDRLELGLDVDVEPALFCTLTITDDGWLTANLLGPLVINPVTRQAKQLVLVDSAFTSRHKIARLSTDGDPACLS